MIAFANVKYTQTFFPSKRCKKLRTRTVTKECPVKIKEVSDKEFPVAFKVRTYEHVLPKVSSFEQAVEIYRHGSGAKSRYFTETVRKFGKKFFRPIRYAYGSVFSVSIAKAADALTRMLSNWQYFGANDSHEFNPETAIVVNDNFKTYFKELKKFASKFVVYHNTLWEETQEPMYTYYTFGLGGGHGSMCIGVDYFRNQSMYWHADQRDQVIKKALKVAEARHEPIDVVKSLKNPKEFIWLVNKPS